MILPSGVPFVSRRERDAFTKPRRECGDSSHITHSTQNFSLLQQQADNRSTALKKTNEDLRLRQTKKKLWTVRGKRRSETEIEEGIEEQREAERERERRKKVMESTLVVRVWGFCIIFILFWLPQSSVLMIILRLRDRGSLL